MRKTPSRISRTLLLGALILSPAAHARGETGVADHEIVIGSCVDTGSPAGIRGRTMLQAARAYFGFVNEKGGVHGRRLRLISHDDRYDPEETVRCFNRLIKENVFAGAFFFGGAEAAKLVPMAESFKVPIVGLAAGAKFIYAPTKHYVFSFRGTFADQAQGLIDNAWNSLSMRKFAVIYQSDAFGAGGLEAVKEALQKRGAVPVAVAGVTRGSLDDLEPALKAVQAAGPDAVVVVTVGAVVKEIAARAGAGGWRPLFMTLTGDPAVYAAEGVVAAQATPPFTDASLPTAALYQRLIKKNNEWQASYSGLEAFVQAMLIVEGLERAGNDPTREKFIAALETIRGFDVGLGDGITVSFSPESHKGTDRVFFTVSREGKPVPLADWKTELKR